MRGRTVRAGTFTAALLLVGLLGAACANNTSGGGPADGDRIEHPTGADQVVLRIERGGGFMPFEWNLANMPLVSLFGDGLLVAPGPQIEIYPGPALPAVTQQRLTPDAVQRILVAARDAGLFQSRDLGNMGNAAIADAPTTTFTVAAGGQTFTTSVYALDELGARPDGMDPDEYRARQDLLAFESKVLDLGWLPEGSTSDQGPYEPSGLRIFVSDYRPSEGLVEPPIAWPLSPALADFGQPLSDTPAQGWRCGTVTGPDLDVLLPLVERANQLSPWTSGGARFGLVFRPLLPDESGC